MLCYAARETLQACTSLTSDAEASKPQDGGSGDVACSAFPGEARPSLSESAGRSTQIATSALDMWSLGVIAIELLTNVSVLAQLVGEEAAVKAALGMMSYPWQSEVGVFAADSIEVLPGLLPADAVRELLQGCLARETSDRPTSAEVVEGVW